VPELPEVELLVRHLQPLLRGKTIVSVEVRRPRVLRPTRVHLFERVVRGARFIDVTRRGKYLLFELEKNRGEPRLLVGHLGMTGRMYFAPSDTTPPKHSAVVFHLSRKVFVFEDPRMFGRMTFDRCGLEALGPEPLGPEFTPQRFAEGLAHSAQAIKVKLMDQSLVAGIGNIYASEALFRARISPRTRANRLSRLLVKRLWSAVRETLTEAVKFGSKAQLDFAGASKGERVFYFGQTSDSGEVNHERFQVYDRAGQPCRRCGTRIKRMVQAGRSSFFCPTCQRAGKSV
jgi:formamidopyrimidine-DNA glycosylase